MKALVSYYTRSGKTDAVVAQIANFFANKKSQLYTDAIVCNSYKNGFFGKLKARLQSANKAPVDVSYKLDPKPYDINVLAFPIWNGHIARPMRTFIEKNKGSFTKVAVIIIHGSGQSKVTEELQELGIKPLRQVEIMPPDFQNEAYKEKMLEFSMTLFKGGLKAVKKRRAAKSGAKK